ncbi:FAD-dependent monooxygenase [Acerihabitans sp. KWT182]|uniref:FAD-dependent monooxygenase n=1 Tax=Acerihabitans sp. KWT182 TaxID=3157919 RepID=A0AAU7QE57_9GAMM
MLDIVIIGAGPAGLATALRLHQKGFRPRLYEAVPELKPLGVGVDIKPYAVKEITEMGLLDAFKAVSVEARESIFYTGHGQQIFAEQCGRHMGYEHDQRFVHRGRLQMMLYQAVLDRLGRDAVTLGCRCTGFEQDDGGVTVRFDNTHNPAAPTSLRADVVIGVDGIRSVVRSKLLPASDRTFFSGLTLYRGVTVMPPPSKPAAAYCTSAILSARARLSSIRSRIMSTAKATSSSIGWWSRTRNPRAKRIGTRRPALKTLNMSSTTANWISWTSAT